MGITTYSFVLAFLPITIIGWRMFLHVKYKNHILAVAFLTIASLLFIGSYDYRFVLLLFCTVLVNYFGVKLAGTMRNVRVKRFLTLCLVVGNVSILLLLKYANWIRSLFGAMERPWNLLLPIGISFYTLEQIMYIVDSCKQTYDYTFMEYLSYSTFFPVIVSGPIFGHSKYMEQLRAIRAGKISDEKVMQGLISFSLGMGKKVLIATQLGKLVDFGYGNLDAMSTGALVLCILSYSLQLYFDFSGYCNIVEGVGLMMGFELPVNFASPYRSASMGEFWKRWHMTLTGFLTHYIYIPLGGNRKGRCRQYVNILLVFLVSGVWHGASVTYVLWGGLHGICVMIDKCVRPYWNRLNQYIRRGVTFAMVTLLWIPFRAESLDVTVKILKGLGNWQVSTAEEFYQKMLPRIASWIGAGGWLDSSQLSVVQRMLTIVFVVVLLLVVFWAKDVTYWRERYCGKLWVAVICGVILSLSVMQFSGVPSVFIYEGF